MRELYIVDLEEGEVLIECFDCGRILPISRKLSKFYDHLDYEGNLCPNSKLNRRGRSKLLAKGPIQFIEAL